MGLVTLLQAEAAGKVSLKSRHLLDLGQQSRVDSLLVSDAGLANGLLLLLLLIPKELSLALLLGLLLVGKVGRGELGNVNGLDRDNGRCGDDIAGVNSPQRNSVNLERTGDKESTILERLQQNDTLTPESAGEDDKNRARNKGSAEDSRTGSLANLDFHDMLATVLWNLQRLQFLQSYSSKEHTLKSKSIFLVFQHLHLFCSVIHNHKINIYTFLGAGISSAGYHFEALLTGIAREPPFLAYKSDIIRKLSFLRVLHS